jgi:beta-lactamase superfamily II metal-dependent hydrolase
VAHHGSRGSSSTPFLAAVRPTVAVISVGANNPFGLPSPESESRLQQQGAHLLRTDRDGTITLLPTSQGILVETSVGSRYLIDTTDVSR